VAVGREREGIERLADIVRDQLNVKQLRFVQAADELGSYEVKPNYRTLGPRFGKRMPQVAAAVEALDPRTSPRHCARAARSASPSTATTTSSAART
jgi:isoleucyl-tRNA synthetase